VPPRKVKLVKMNIDEHPAISGRWESSIPPSCLRQWPAADGFMARCREPGQRFIDKLPRRDRAGRAEYCGNLQEAEAVLAEGDPACCRPDLCRGARAHSTNIAALRRLAKCYVTSGAIEQAKQTIGMCRVEAQ